MSWIPLKIWGMWIIPYCMGFYQICQDHGIAVGPGRGSAAGSIVSYCLGITNDRSYQVSASL